MLSNAPLGYRDRHGAVPRLVWWAIATSVLLALSLLVMLAPPAEAEDIGSVVGGVFHDLDGDGLQSDGEPGLSNVPVELYDHNSNLRARSTSTASDGGYRFSDVLAGSYAVVISVPDGYEIVGEPRRDQQVHRGVVEDGPRFGIRATIGVDLLGNSTFQDSVVGWRGSSATVTQYQGMQQNAEALLSRVCSAPDPHDPLLEPSLPTIGGKFVGIQGRAFLDRDGDGLRSSTEPGLGNVEVQLTGQGRDDVVLTNWGGWFQFMDDLSPGEYTLTPSAPEEYSPLGPRTVTIPRGEFSQGNDLPIRRLDGADAPLCLDINTVASLDTGGLEGFAARVALACPTPAVQPPTEEATPPQPTDDRSIIMGRAFLDHNGDGQHSEGEPGVAGVKVEIGGEGREEQTTASTDRNGIYLFEKVEPGDYSLWVTGVPDAYYTQDLQVFRFQVQSASLHLGPPIRVYPKPGESPGTCSRSYGVNDGGGNVQRSRRGELFIARIWVKASDGSAGKTVRLTLRESGGNSASRAGQSVAVLLTDTWQHVGLEYTIGGSSPRNLTLSVTQDNARPGDAFLVDSARLSFGRAMAEPAAPSGLTLTPQEGQVLLAWGTSPDAAGYTVERKSGETWVQVATVGASQTSFTYLTGAATPPSAQATPGDFAKLPFSAGDSEAQQTATYRVSAFNDGGTSDYSEAVTETGETVESTPTPTPTSLPGASGSPGSVGEVLAPTATHTPDKSHSPTPTSTPAPTETSIEAPTETAVEEEPTEEPTETAVEEEPTEEPTATETEE